MRPYAGVDHNITLCRLQHMHHGKLYARVDINPMPESTLDPSQGRIWPQNATPPPPPVYTCGLYLRVPRVCT
jgi:hypothetical protein